MNVFVVKDNYIRFDCIFQNKLSFDFMTKMFYNNKKKLTLIQNYRKVRKKI